MYSDLSPGFFESDILHHSSQSVSPAICGFIVCHVTARDIIYQVVNECNNFFTFVKASSKKVSKGFDPNKVKPFLSGFRLKTVTLSIILKIYYYTLLSSPWVNNGLTAPSFFRICQGLAQLLQGDDLGDKGFDINPT